MTKTCNLRYARLYFVRLLDYLRKGEKYTQHTHLHFSLILHDVCLNISTSKDSRVLNNYFFGGKIKLRWLKSLNIHYLTHSLLN